MSCGKPLRLRDDNTSIKDSSKRNQLIMIMLIFILVAGIFLFIVAKELRASKNNTSSVSEASNILEDETLVDDNVNPKENDKQDDLSNEREDSQKEFVNDREKVESVKISNEKAQSSLSDINDSLSNYIWAVLMTNDLSDKGNRINVDLSDAEKMRAAVLASQADDVIDDVFIYRDGKPVIDNSAESGPYGDGFHGFSVSYENVEQNCLDLFGTKAAWDELQTEARCYSTDAVRYSNGEDVFAIIISDDTETETDMESHDRRIKKDGDEFIGEVDIYFGYWGELAGNPGYSNYRIEYTLEPYSESKYGLIVSGITIERIDEGMDLPNDIQTGEAETNTPGMQGFMNQPFYGVWCSASKDAGDAKKAADKLTELGFDGQVFVSDEWDNLNKEKWYVVTAGIYFQENEAGDALGKVKSVGYPNAYVKYTGEYIGD